MIELLKLLEGPEESKAWIKSNLDFPHDWCLIWPFSRIQSGYAKFGAKHIAVHRFMCEYKHGPAPSPKHHAAHSCGRGHEGCVNPRHIAWKTISENQLERFRHSGYQPRWKLTPEQVDQIRALKGRARVIDIAHQFGVSDTNIRSIHAGRLWRKDRPGLDVWTEDEVRRIRSAPRGGSEAAALAKEFGVSVNAIYRIRNGQTLHHIDEAPASPQISLHQWGTEL
jgi:hypothetical protein